MLDLKINSKTISNTTITKIIDQILYNLLISALLKPRSNCLKDIIEPMIKINFKTLGYDKLKLLEKIRFITKDKNKKESKYSICLFKTLKL